MPVSTSLSASSLNESAGARTPLASLITGVLVLLTLLVLAPVFSSLPKPVLAALIIDAVVFGMIDVAELRRLYRVKRVDFVIAAVAIVGVLSVGVLAGVVFGIALSLGWLVYVASSCCDPTAGCSSPPPTPCTTGFARSPGTATRRSTRSCSTSRASTSSTPKGPRNWSSSRSSPTSTGSR
jgi:hypothetical protein